MISDVAQIIIGVGTLLMAVFLLVHEYRGRKIATQEQINKAFNDISALGLSSEDNLKALAKVLYPTQKNNLDVLRQRLFSYLVLNATELTFIAESQKGIKQKTAHNIVEDLLGSALRNKEAWSIMEAGTYDRNFTQLAKRIKKEMLEQDKNRKRNNVL